MSARDAHRRMTHQQGNDIITGEEPNETSLEDFGTGCWVVVLPIEGVEQCATLETSDLVATPGSGGWVTSTPPSVSLPRP